ncbi:MAG: hypothetical protein H0T84_13255 [Tatlockia sp.]|nr:hypothetical protein [Tatlockia sp.]
MSEFDRTKKHIKDDAKELYDNAHDKASNSYVDIKNATETIAEQVKESAANIYEEGSKKINQTTDYVCSSSADLIAFIKANPVKSVLMALSAGFILTKLFKK